MKAFENPGVVSFAWHGYFVETSSAFVATIAILLVILAFWVGGVWTLLAAAPAWFKNKRKWKSSQKSVDDFVHSMELVALGDHKKAEKIATSIAKQQPQLANVVLSQLSGHLSTSGKQLLIEGSSDERPNIFNLLARIKEAEIQKEWTQMLALVQQACQKYPKSEEVIHVLFKAYLHTGMFKEALPLAEKLKVSTFYGSEELDNLVASIYVAIGHKTENAEERCNYYKKSLKASPKFIPAMEALFKEIPSEKDVCRWLATCPHPVLVDMFYSATNSLSEKKREKYWLQIKSKLDKEYAGYSDYIQSILCEKLDKVDDAYYALKESTNTLNHPKIYRKLAQLEAKRNGSDEKRAQWLEQAIDANDVANLLGEDEIKSFEYFKSKYPVQDQPKPQIQVDYVSL